MRAVQIVETGGPEVMKLADVPIPEPGPGQVRIAVEAAGLNFLDTYLRSGVYPVEVPLLIGKECAGTVSAVGQGVDNLSVGDRVATPLADGTYADECIAPAPLTFRVPDGVDSATAAAAALQGLTAHYLAYSTFELQAGHRCLIHAGAGGVGGLLIQMAKRLGAEVFTTVGTDEKAAVAAEAGADHVIVYTAQDFVEAVRAEIGDGGLDVVYDGVGKDTFDGGLSLLRPRGMMALFGGSSGQVPPFDLQRLNTAGSLFVTRPSLGHYIAPPEGQSRADDLFGWIASGELDIRIGARYGLEQAAEAHRALEGRLTTGKVLLLP
ncbi:MAG: quinone oxidoreductase family protein, partial [Acidimicrobiales bacterium]